MSGGKITPLMLACHHGSVEAIEVLLEFGADPTRCDRDEQPIRLYGRTPLATACLNGDTQIVKLLLASAIFTQEDLGEALIFASLSGDLEIMKALVESGASPDYRDKNGYNTLINACYMGIFDNVKYLLDSGANPNVEDCESITPLISAAINVDRHLAKLLLEYGANVDHKCADGSTPLAHVVSCYITQKRAKGDMHKDYKGFAKFLVENGAKPIPEEEGDAWLDTVYTEPPSYGEMWREMLRK